MSSGQVSPSQPTELLQSETMRELLAEPARGRRLHHHRLPTRACRRRCARRRPDGRRDLVRRERADHAARRRDRRASAQLDQVGAHLLGARSSTTPRPRGPATPTTASTPSDQRPHSNGTASTWKRLRKKSRLVVAEPAPPRRRRGRIVVPVLVVVAILVAVEVVFLLGARRDLTSGGRLTPRDVDRRWQAISRAAHASLRTGPRSRSSRPSIDRTARSARSRAASPGWGTPPTPSPRCRRRASPCPPPARPWRTRSRPCRTGSVRWRPRAACCRSSDTRPRRPPCDSARDDATQAAEPWGPRPIGSCPGRSSRALGRTATGDDDRHGSRRDLRAPARARRLRGAQAPQSLPRARAESRQSCEARGASGARTRS